MTRRRILVGGIGNADAMANLLGVLDFLVGTLFCALSVWAVTGMPAAVMEYPNEPEDLVSLVVASLLCALTGGIAVIAGIVLFRRRALWIFAPSRTSTFVIFASMILVLLAALGFSVNEPSSKELTYLILPAVIFIASYPMLRKLRESP